LSLDRSDIVWHFIFSVNFVLLTFVTLYLLQRVNIVLLTWFDMLSSSQCQYCPLTLFYTFSSAKCQYGPFDIVWHFILLTMSILCFWHCFHFLFCKVSIWSFWHCLTLYPPHSVNIVLLTLFYTFSSAKRQYGPFDIVWHFIVFKDSILSFWHFHSFKSILGKLRFVCRSTSDPNLTMVEVTVGVYYKDDWTRLTVTYDVTTALTDVLALSQGVIYLSSTNTKVTLASVTYIHVTSASQRIIGILSMWTCTK